MFDNQLLEWLLSMSCWSCHKFVGERKQPIKTKFESLSQLISDGARNRPLPTGFIIAVT